jgi:hypothetical protein
LSRDISAPTWKISFLHHRDPTSKFVELRSQFKALCCKSDGIDVKPKTLAKKSNASAAPSRQDSRHDPRQSESGLGFSKVEAGRIWARLGFLAGPSRPLTTSRFITSSTSSHRATARCLMRVRHEAGRAMLAPCITYAHIVKCFCASIPRISHTANIPATRLQLTRPIHASLRVHPPTFHPRPLCLARRRRLRLHHQGQSKSDTTRPAQLPSDSYRIQALFTSDQHSAHQHLVASGLTPITSA